MYQIHKPKHKSQSNIWNFCPKCLRKYRTEDKIVSNCCKDGLCGVSDDINLVLLVDNKFYGIDNNFIVHII